MSDPERDDEAAPPPFGGSWRRLYAAVLFALALQIALYALLSRLFR